MLVLCTASRHKSLSRLNGIIDTMNTAARMEGTGFKGRIQISQDTADCLVEQGKENWFTPRTDMKVVAKGIGEIQTYWLCLGSESDFGLSPLPNANRAPSEREADITHVSNIELVDEQRTLSISTEKISRLIDWNVDTLLQLLKRIVAFRKLQGKPAYRIERTAPYEQEFGSVGLTSVVDEVKEVIHLPQKDTLGALNDAMVDSITLQPEVVEQLYAFVTSIAALYNANPFHSFEHASHVTMSVVKLLSRIVAPNLVDMIGKTLHDHTYGITSDPLTQFACVFSALIHDGTLENAKGTWCLTRCRGYCSPLFVVPMRSRPPRNSKRPIDQGECCPRPILQPAEPGRAEQHRSVVAAPHGLCLRRLEEGDLH